MKLFRATTMALAALVAAEAVKQKLPFEKRVRRELRPDNGSKGGKGKGGKGKSSAEEEKDACPEPPSCPNFPISSGNGKSGKGGKSGGGKSGKGGKGGKSSSGSCGDGGTEDTVVCGGAPYVNTTLTLTKDLFCNGDFGRDGPIIEMQGPDALLDCDGNSIQGTVDDGIGVLLVDGASVVNCNFKGFYSSVETQGVGCSTIMNVNAAFAGQDGISIENSGTAILSGVTVTGPASDGVEIGTSGSDTDVVLHDVTVTGAGSNGIRLTGGMGPVGLYGDVVVEFNDGSGFQVGASAFVITAYCNFSILNNGNDGISLFTENNNITFADGSVTTACYHSEEDDIDGDNGLFQMTGATIVCDSITDPGNVTCTPCPPLENVTGCVAE